MSKNYLIIDQGGRSSRAIVFTKKGKPLAYVSDPVADCLPSTTGLIEFDSQRIITSIRQLLERVAEQLKPKELQNISCAGIICQRSSLIACNKSSGKAITPLIGWQDTRNSQWLNQQSLDADDFRRRTGIRLNAHVSASKMRWLLDHNHQVQALAKQNKLLFLPWGSYLLYQLTNADTFVCDPVLAARTGLTKYGRLKWSKKLLDLFGLDKTSLPQVVPTSHDYGQLRINKTTIPVNLLGGDQNFIPYAYGLDTINEAAFINLGTGAFIQAAVSKKQKDTPLLTTTTAVEEYKQCPPFLEGTINAAASALDWWQEQLERPISYGELNELLATETYVPTFINLLSGSGSPFWLSGSTPYFIEADELGRSNQKQKAIAVIESILFACKLNFDLIHQHNPGINQIVISGGLSRLDNLCQQMANLLNTTVVRYPDSEASARGVVFYLTQKNKYKPNEEPSHFLPYKQTQLLMRFNRYKEIMTHLAQST